MTSTKKKGFADHLASCFAEGVCLPSAGLDSLSERKNELNSSGRVLDSVYPPGMIIPFCISIFPGCPAATA